MPVYSKTSPYANTSQDRGYLDVASFRNISSVADDVLFLIPTQYERRPDLLAYDLYGDSTLWWVFSVRNKNIIHDPIYDMVAGVEIYLPKYETLRAELGI